MAPLVDAETGAQRTVGAAYLLTHSVNGSEVSLQTGRI